MAFLQEPRPQPFLHVPAAVTGLIGVLVVAHAARMLAPVLVGDAIITNYAFNAARYSPAFLAAHHAAPQSFSDLAIPFVSYIFIHGSWTHLAINCIWLLPFGAIVARRLGPLLFFALFLVSGIAGAFAILLTYWGVNTPVVGASGAISGIMAMGFRIIAPIEALDLQSFAAAVGQEVRSPRPLVPIFSGRLMLWSALWMVINVIAGVTGLGAGTGPQVIAWQAHIGGYIAGLLAAGPLDGLARRVRPNLEAP